MVCLDMDHPEIVDFINWKVREEKKAHALIAAGYSSDFNGEAYHTVSGQNSNNSVRVTDEFMKAVAAGGKWQTTHAHDRRGRRHATTRSDLWSQVAEAAWALRRPGRAVRHDDQPAGTRARTPGRINASNPCSEYMFLDDTACNLSSLNLTKFLARRRRHQLRRRGLPPRVPRLLHGAGDPGRSLELPDEGHRAELATTTARSASATRTSARC